VRTPEGLHSSLVSICTSCSVYSWGITRMSFFSSMATFWRGPCSLFYLQSWSSFLFMHPWVKFLPTAEAILGLPGAAWQLLAGCQCTSTQLRETQYRLCVFYIIYLIINIIGIISKTFYIQFVSLSPFSSSSLPLVSEG